jgi:hypothetical protein
MDEVATPPTSELPAPRLLGKGKKMHIHRREYLIAGAVFLAIGLFGIFTDRW